MFFLLLFPSSFSAVSHEQLGLYVRHNAVKNHSVNIFFLSLTAIFNHTLPYMPDI